MSEKEKKETVKWRLNCITSETLSAIDQSGSWMA